MRRMAFLLFLLAVAILCALWEAERWHRQPVSDSGQTGSDSGNTGQPVTPGQPVVGIGQSSQGTPIDPPDREITVLESQGTAENVPPEMLAFYKHFKKSMSGIYLANFPDNAFLSPQINIDLYHEKDRPEEKILVVWITTASGDQIVLWEKDFNDLKRQWLGDNEKIERYAAGAAKTSFYKLEILGLLSD